MPTLPPLRALVRPVAVLAAGLLAAGVLQAGPAAADPGDASPSVSVTVSAPSGVPGSGSSVDDPARLGPPPGATDLEVRVANTGDEPMHGVAAAVEVLANGSITAPSCDVGAGDDPVLDPGSTVACTAHLSGVGAAEVHHDRTTVTATGVGSGSTVSATADFWASAADDPVGLGDRVWIDSDGDGTQDDGEPGIAGVRLTVAGPTARRSPTSSSTARSSGRRPRRPTARTPSPTWRRSPRAPTR